MTQLYAVRLQTGADLKLSILEYVERQGISAGAVVSCVGALSRVRVRLAGATPDNQPVFERTENYEIVSMTGTVGAGDAHLHIAVANEQGAVIGGHLKDGCVIDITTELVILADPALRFARRPDPATGFDELEVETV